MTADDARREAWDAANRRRTTRQNSEQLYNRAQLAVLRQVVSRLLPDGEASFWRLVREEIER